MELDEGALMQRFDRAVSDLTPDVVASGGRWPAARRAMRRRRRIASGAGLVAAAAVTVGAVAHRPGALRPRVGRTHEPEPDRSRAARAGDAAWAGGGRDRQLGRGEPFDGRRSDRARGRRPVRDPAGGGHGVRGRRGEVRDPGGRQLRAVASGIRWMRCSEPQPGAQTLWCDDTPLATGHRPFRPSCVRRLTAPPSRLPPISASSRSSVTVRWWLPSRRCSVGTVRSTPPTPCR